MLHNFWPLIMVGVAGISLGVVMALPLCKISKRLGYHPLFGLVAVVPFGTFIWSCVVAYSQWPKVQAPR